MGFLSINLHYHGMGGTAWSEACLLAWCVPPVPGCALCRPVDLQINDAANLHVSGAYLT